MNEHEFMKQAVLNMMSAGRVDPAQIVAVAQFSLYQMQEADVYFSTPSKSDSKPVKVLKTAVKLAKAIKKLS